MPRSSRIVLELGISIIDIDRVLGEVGLGLDGGSTAERIRCPHYGEETVRVIEDYGYFDDRPITAQVGRIGVGEETEMPLPGLVRSGLSAWRQVAGNDTALEQWAKKRYLHYVSSQLRRDRGKGGCSGREGVLSSLAVGRQLPEPRRGIVLQGGCDLLDVHLWLP